MTHNNPSSSSDASSSSHQAPPEASKNARNPTRQAPPIITCPFDIFLQEKLPYYKVKYGSHMDPKTLGTMMKVDWDGLPDMERVQYEQRFKVYRMKCSMEGQKFAAPSRYNRDNDPTARFGTYERLQDRERSLLDRPRGILMPRRAPGGLLNTGRPQNSPRILQTPRQQRIQNPMQNQNMRQIPNQNQNQNQNQNPNPEERHLNLNLVVVNNPKQWDHLGQQTQNPPPTTTTKTVQIRIQNQVQIQNQNQNPNLRGILNSRNLNPSPTTTTQRQQTLQQKMADALKNAVRSAPSAPESTPLSESKNPKKPKIQNPKIAPPQSPAIPGKVPRNSEVLPQTQNFPFVKVTHVKSIDRAHLNPTTIPMLSESQTAPDPAPQTAPIALLNIQNHPKIPKPFSEFRKKFDDQVGIEKISPTLDLPEDYPLLDVLKDLRSKRFTNIGLNP